MVFRTIPAPKGALLRVLGVGFGVAVSLGNSIGAGIMRTPAEIAERLPSASLIMLAWIVGAFYTLLGAWSLSEVAAMNSECWWFLRHRPRNRTRRG